MENNCYHIVKSYNQNIKAEFTLKKKKTLVILYDGMCLGNNKFDVKYLSIIGYNYQILRTKREEKHKICYNTVA